MEWLKDIKPLVDLGITGLFGGAVLFMVWKPPKWIVKVVDSHHQLAVGVKALGNAVDSMPKREEMQELLIGQEALRRETVETRAELRGLHQDVIALGTQIHGLRG